RVADAQVALFDGDLEDYGRWLVTQQGKTASSANTPSSPTQGQDNTARSAAADRERRREAAERRSREKPYRDRLSRLERDIDEHRRRLKEIEQRLADPAIYSSGQTDRFAELAKEQSDLKRRMEAAEEQWLETAEALEGGTSV